MQGGPYDEQPVPPRRGRRDNGLNAERFIPLLDVDPRIGEHLLDVLKLAGVPAYLEPAMDVEPYTRAASVPSPPTDRLWVDRDLRETARDVIHAETSANAGAETAAGPPATPSADPVRRASRRDDAERPDGWPGDPADQHALPDEAPSHGLADPAEEQSWLDIIARYDSDPTSLAVPPWPVAEDVDGPNRGSGRAAPTAPTAAGSTGRTEPDRTAAPAEPKPAEPADQPEPPRQAGRHAAVEPAQARPEAATHAAAQPPADAGDHYVPPPPPPVPRLSRQTILALGLIVIGALLLLFPNLMGFGSDSGLALGVLALVSATGLLVLRLREDRFDDPDDGAVL
ncbi:MAG TPA: hypothetical protein VLJ59_00335 [Mycobacteriales bacterium]|nr:hypothetical protein [Mycobacteriales bacterium]